MKNNLYIFSNHHFVSTDIRQQNNEEEDFFNNQITLLEK